MKPAYLLILLILFTQCSNISRVKVDPYSTSPGEDTEILAMLLEELADESQAPTGDLMVKVGTWFLETPYVASTLEQEGEERLVINLRELDCTTFAESCLAITKTIQSGKPTFDQFTQELVNIRYRNSKIKGYTSRLHYTTDWIWENQQKQLVQDVTKDIAQIPYVKTINFMSTHPDSYVQLKANIKLVEEMIAIEKDITGRSYYYIPKEKLAGFESTLQDGDIVALTTSIGGLDVSHMGILVRKNNRIHLLHASLTAKKVVLSEETLEEYLKNSKSVTGIIVARPL
jgi:hypothetical protein